MNGVKFISLVLSMHIINTAGIPVAHDVSLGNIYREVLLTLFFFIFFDLYSASGVYFFLNIRNVIFILTLKVF